MAKGVVQKEAVNKVYVVPHRSVFPDPDQPRKHFDLQELTSLAECIKKGEQLYPILVRHHHQKKGCYMIIDGERRWRAHGIIKQETIEVIIKDMPPEDILEVSVIANFGRADMTEIETSVALQKLKKQKGYSDVQMAQRVGRSVAWVGNMLKYSRLHPTIQNQLTKRVISPAVALSIANYPLQDQLRVLSELRKSGDLQKGVTASRVHRRVLEAAERAGVRRERNSRGKEAYQSEELLVRSIERKAQDLTAEINDLLGRDEKKLDVVNGVSLDTAYDSLILLARQLPKAVGVIDKSR